MENQRPESYQLFVYWTNPIKMVYVVDPLEITSYFTIYLIGKPTAITGKFCLLKWLIFHMWTFTPWVISQKKLGYSGMEYFKLAVVIYEFSMALTTKYATNWMGFKPLMAIWSLRFLVVG